MSAVSHAPRERTRAPIAAAAARDARNGTVLGALGLGACAIVLLALVGAWRVGPHASVHGLLVLGQPVSYPAANAAALTVLTLAAVGLAVLVLATLGVGRQALGARRLDRRLRTMRAPSTEHPDAFVIVDDRPLAFCAGLFRPRVFISTGALERLDELAVAAVLAHERHHAHRRDPLRLATRQVLTDALFFVPGLTELRRREDLLSELAADASAIEATPHGRAGLARAMLCFDDAGAVDPRRADQLLGELTRWSLPVSLLAAAGGAIALFAALGMLAARMARGSTTLALPFLSSRPCVVVLALLPIALGATTWRARRARS